MSLESLAQALAQALARATKTRIHQFHVLIGQIIRRFIGSGLKSPQMQ
jgi:hypothetical protein